MHIVQKQWYNTPIYTVHENFITTAKHSHKLPDLYTKIFQDMGPPIRIINEFIYDNILYLPYKAGKLDAVSISKFISYDIITYKPDVYTDDILKLFLDTYLSMNFPVKGSNKLLKEWEKKNKDIVLRYRMYAETVYSRNSFVGLKKWYDFYKLLLDNELNPKDFTHNYSLHH